MTQTLTLIDERVAESTEIPAEDWESSNPSIMGTAVEELPRIHQGNQTEIDNKISGTNAEEEQGSLKKIHFAISCKSPSSRWLSKDKVGNNAFWDFDLNMWFLETKEEAEIVVGRVGEGKYFIQQVYSKLFNTFLSGSPLQKKAVKLRHKYEIAKRELDVLEKDFDLHCEKCNLSLSAVAGEPMESFSVQDRKNYRWLKNEYNKIEEKKAAAEDLKKKYIEAEAKANEYSKNGSSRVQENDLPNIQIIPGQLHETTNRSEQVLISNVGIGIFQRSGQLVRIISETSKSNKNKKELIKRPADSLLITEVDHIYLTELLGKYANWTRFDERTGDWIVKDCPERVAKTLIARREWGVPILSGIIQAPTLRTDGSILDVPGYDHATGLFFNPGNTEFCKISLYPSKDEALFALETILNLLSDFPFENDESKSVAVSAILTGLIRKSIRTAPLHGFTAPKMGSGKSLLADIVGLISTGKNNSVIPQSENEAEEKKRLLSVLSEGDAIICYDNIERPFGSASLCSVLTQESFKDRLLGVNRSLSVPTNATFLATGNNLNFVGDTSTRAILCRLDPGCERPEERRFNVDLRKYIPEHRGSLVTAAIIILRAYHVANRPKQDIPQYGRFEDWSDWVRSALVWLGMADPCASRKDIENSDPVRQSLGNLLSSWYLYIGDLSLRIKDIVKKAETEKEVTKAQEAEALFDALLEISPDNRGGINIRSLGVKLAKFKGRIEGGYRLENTGKYQGTDMWRVMKIL